jgi:excisionase family DNA binding protein
VPDVPDEPYDLSVGDVAAQLSIHEDTVRRWAAKGALRSWVTPGGRRRFRQSDVDALTPDDSDRAAS